MPFTEISTTMATKGNLSDPVKVYVTFDTITNKTTIVLVKVRSCHVQYKPSLLSNGTRHIEANISKYEGKTDEARPRDITTAHSVTAVYKKSCPLLLGISFSSLL